MITLKGKNLCERQKELNFMVKEAAENKVDLKEVKPADTSDVDRIFKIDLASKLKNTDYIIEELKSGDSLYVSKALKCEWLYGSDYAHLINPDYLHHHIFPKMSIKMQKKTLSYISIYLRDATRAQLFYEYCMNTKMQNNAVKFLIFTAESFKDELMNDDSRFNDLYRQVEVEYFTKFIGNSFALADTFGKKEKPIIELPHLYSLNEKEFLNLLEKHTKAPFGNKSVGVKMSRSILKKYKDRVLRKPLLYLSILNKSELVKHTSPENAQVYAAALLPDLKWKFWNSNYHKNNKHILDLIKTPSIFEYVKNMYTQKYNTTEFEMSKEFYEYRYYDLMTFEEREDWALRHLQERTDVIPEDENYRWYKFITFAKSFKEIKSQIYTTTNPGIRTSMLIVLVESAKTQRDLKELLNYCYKRHVNEKRDKKLAFVTEVMDHHKVLEFDDACWVPFNKLLHSIKISTLTYWGDDDLIVVSLIYHIINKKTLSEDLLKYLKRTELREYDLKYCLGQLNSEKKDLVFNYINQFLIDLISEFESQKYNDNLKTEVRPYLKRLEELRRRFDKDEKYPDIVVKYMKLDLKNFGHIVEPKDPKKTLEITEGYLLRCLKQDASLIVEKMPLIKDAFNNSYDFRINLLSRRIKIFFSNDIAKQCLEFCTKTLYDSLPNNAIIEHKAIFAIVLAIFQMGDEKTKTEIMDKFVPTNPKIDHDEITSYVLRTQEAICRFQCYSRPPMPLSKTALYLKGDYAQKCDDMLNMYLVNLPPALRTDYIKLLLDAPISVQKRGLRLAFKTFEVSNLKDLVSSVWNKTKNVSLRQVIYLLLLNKMLNEAGKTQEDMFELLKEVTLTLHQDDTDEVFACFRDHKIPEKFKSSYLQTAWKVVAALPRKKSSFERKISVIKEIKSNMRLMDEKFLESFIYDHVNKILSDQKLRPGANDDIVELNEAMWKLTQRYIVEIPNEPKQERSLKLLEAIVKECLDHWDEDYDTEDLVFQVFFRNFVHGLESESSFYANRYRNVVHIFEYLLERFENHFGISEMYSYFWDWKLILMIKKAVNGEMDSDKEICINFGLQIGVFIKELKDKNLCYNSFFNEIGEKIACSMKEMKSLYVIYHTLDITDVSILVARGVTLTETFETCLLALEILPTNPTEKMKTEYLEVTKKIKEQNNAELNALMNDKLIYRDLKKRKFVMTSPGHELLDRKRVKPEGKTLPLLDRRFL